MLCLLNQFSDTHAGHHCRCNCSWRALFSLGHMLSKPAVGRTRPTMDSFATVPCNIVCNLKYRCWRGWRFIFQLNCGVIRGVLLRWLDQGSFVPRRMAGLHALSSVGCTRPVHELAASCYLEQPESLPLQTATAFINVLYTTFRRLSLLLQRKFTIADTELNSKLSRVPCCFCISMLTFYINLLSHIFPLTIYQIHARTLSHSNSEISCLLGYGRRQNDTMWSDLWNSYSQWPVHVDVLLF